MLLIIVAFIFIGSFALFFGVFIVWRWRKRLPLKQELNPPSLEYPSIKTFAKMSPTADNKKPRIVRCGQNE